MFISIKDKILIRKVNSTIGHHTNQLSPV